MYVIMHFTYNIFLRLVELRPFRVFSHEWVKGVLDIYIYILTCSPLPQLCLPARVETQRLRKFILCHIELYISLLTSVYNCPVLFPLNWTMLFYYSVLIPVLGVYYIPPPPIKVLD